ncbi:MAG: hypothetical protein JWR85_11 [Marmoricola sp.]|nr:hypothetical protein [Marmoricola sp.]
MSPTLTDLLHDNTDDLILRPGFTEAVVRGGRRRQMRRRTAMTGTLALLGFGLTAVTVQGLPTGDPAGFAGGQPTPESSPISATQGGVLADGRMHGDLAKDEAYLSAVQVSWSRWMAKQDSVYEHPRGQAQVVWAGTTPAGPAALLRQEVDLLKKVGDSEPGRYSALGFIGVGNDGPRVAAHLFNADERNSLAWYVDLAHRTLVVTDNSVARGVSFGWRYAADGRRSRDYQPLTFRDGAAVVVLPPRIDRTTVAVSDLPRVDQRGAVYVANVELSGDGDTGYMNGLDWADPRGGLGLPLAEGPLLTPQQAAEGHYAIANRLSALTTGSYMFGGPGRGIFLVYGTTPNGTPVRLTQEQLEGDEAQLYMTYGNDLRHVGPADPSKALPVMVALPNGQGWLVARRGAALRYREGNGAWITAHADAALLPATATVVEVSPEGAPSMVVPLPEYPR